MQDIKINTIQTNLIWENPQQNLANLEHRLSDAKGLQDIVLLPEMFNTGFTTNYAKCAEAPDGATFQWMKKMAASLQCIIAGTFLCAENNTYYNRLIWMMPDGNFKKYDKRHLFRFGNEHLSMAAGNQNLIVSCGDWKIKLLICYDLRFPVWAKNNYNNGTFDYDCLIYLANWPLRRIHHWKTLLQARAIENLAYTIGVNRVGSDGNGISYNGNSLAFSPKGEPLTETEENVEKNILLTLSKTQLNHYRQHFNVGLDWDTFEIIT